MVIAAPAPAHACEPILPLVQLFSGTLLYPGALVLLGGTVLLKALAFALFEKDKFTGEML